MNHWHSSAQHSTAPFPRPPTQLLFPKPLQWVMLPLSQETVGIKLGEKPGICLPVLVLEEWIRSVSGQAWWDQPLEASPAGIFSWHLPPQLS